MVTGLRRFYPFFGVAGCLVAAGVMLVAGLAYTGTKGESFSPVNHFISELGQQGVSQLAWLFNAGLIAAGLMFVPFMLGLGLDLGGVWSKLGMLSGAVAGAALSLVGVFPMNNLQPHVLAATTYFRMGLVAIFFFAIAIFRQPRGQERIQRWVNWASFAAVLCFGVFVVYLATATQGTSGLDPKNIERPDVWLPSILEWATFFATVGWCFVVALGRKR